MLKNNALKAKDELLNYYEILISKLLKRMGKIAADYDEDAKSKLIADIALDFANSNIKDDDMTPSFALQYILCKKFGVLDDFDAGRYSAREDGFNFHMYCYDLGQLLDFEVSDAGGVDEKAGEKLQEIYSKYGWTPALRRIKNSKA